jgi:hypothetical protein
MNSSDVISTLIAHGLLLAREFHKEATTGALFAKITEGCKNPQCKAKKKTSHTTENCYWPGGGKEGQFPPNFGQRSKANIATSTPPPAPTSTTTPNPNQTEHYVLSALNSQTPGQSGVLIEGVPSDTPVALISQGFQGFRKGEAPTFMDSGASDTMFVEREAFTEYKLITPRKGDSAKADGGSF